MAVMKPFFLTPSSYLSYSYFLLYVLGVFFLFFYSSYALWGYFQISSTAVIINVQMSYLPNPFSPMPVPTSVSAGEF